MSFPSDAIRQSIHDWIGCSAIAQVEIEHAWERWNNVRDRQFLYSLSTWASKLADCAEQVAQQSAEFAEALSPSAN